MGGDGRVGVALVASSFKKLIGRKTSSLSTANVIARNVVVEIENYYSINPI
jgi:hypothetical protein